MSFSQSSVLKCLSAVCTAMILGCGPSDGSKELLEGKEAYDLRDLNGFSRKAWLLRPRTLTGSSAWRVRSSNSANSTGRKT